MINKNRIVPVQATDLISLYAVIMAQSVETLAKIDAADEKGNFSITAAATPLLASEPVKTADFGESVSTATIYFVPAYDYAGFTAEGEAVTATGTVEADGCSLYKAQLASGAVTITKIGL